MAIVGVVCPRCGKAAHGSVRVGDCPGTVAGVPDTDPDGAAGASDSFDGADATALGSGTYVGEYVVDAIIGRGGMGTVYRAVQPLIGKKVAIKVVRGTLAQNKVAIQRFIQEARAVNAIGHRNLVDIFSFGQLTDGRYYFVMEYLEGENLRARLSAQGRLPPGQAIPIFIDVARALGAAHAKSIVHRDLKPDNVFLARDPEGGPPHVKLLDFGVAKLLEAQVGQSGPLTAHGSTLGTPHYMSPEQCRGGALDGRTDIYALGVMLYEAVTGTLPITGGAPMEICWAQVREHPQPAIARAPGLVNPELNDLIMRMLAKDPESRPQTAREVREALDAMLSGVRPAAEVTPAPHATPVRGVAALQDAFASLPTTSDLVAIDGSPGSSKVKARDFARELRAELGVKVAEPAIESPDPSQASLFVVDLSALAERKRPPSRTVPAPHRPVERASSSARVPRASTREVARRPTFVEQHVVALVATAVVAVIVFVIVLLR